MAATSKPVRKQMKKNESDRNKLEKTASKTFSRMGLPKHPKQEIKADKKRRTEKSFAKGMAQNTLSSKGNKKAYQ